MSQQMSKREKGLLAQLATRAWRFQGALARGRGEAWDISADDFRHREVMQATGKAGLTECTHDDYNPIAARLTELLKQPGQSFEHHMRAPGEEKRRAYFVLLQEMGKHADVGITLRYVQAIATRQFKTALEDCTAGQLRNLLFTVRNRAQAKRRQTMKAKA